MGSPGNVRFRAAIIPIVDTTLISELVYRGVNKKWFAIIVVDNKTALIILPEEQT